MGLFKSWRNKSAKTLKDNSSVLDSSDADKSTDFGPKPTNYGDSSGKSRKSIDKLRSYSADRLKKGPTTPQGNGKAKASTPSSGSRLAEPERQPEQRMSLPPSHTDTRPGKNGSPPITPKSPARLPNSYFEKSVDDNHDTPASKLSNVVATGPAASGLVGSPEQSSIEQPRPQAVGMTASDSGMTRSTSRTSYTTEAGKPRPSELFAGKGVQWDAVKLAGPGSAPAEQNRVTGGENKEDLQQFLKARRQWKPTFSGADKDDDAERFQPPKDLNKLSFGSTESQKPSRGLLSLDDLEQSHTRKQHLLDDTSLALDPVAGSSNPRPKSSAPPVAPSGAVASALPNSNDSPSRPGRLGSAFSFRRKSSSSSVKRNPSQSSKKGQGIQDTPASLMPTSASNGDVGHAALNTAVLTGAAAGVTSAVSRSSSKQNGMSNGHTSTKPDLASGNLEAPRTSAAPTSSAMAPSKPDFASGNLQASSAAQIQPVAAAPATDQVDAAAPTGFAAGAAEPLAPTAAEGGSATVPGGVEDVTARVPASSVPAS